MWIQKTLIFLIFIFAAGLLDEIILFIDERFSESFKKYNRRINRKVQPYEESTTIIYHATNEKEYEKSVLMESNGSGAIHHIVYRDIPDLDAGRIPYPESSKGRYALGERKTTILLLLDSFSNVEIERTLNSLWSVLSDPSNRVYVDIMLVDWEGTNRESLFNQRSQIEDCSLHVLLVKREKTKSHFSLIQESMKSLSSNHYEQVILMNEPVEFARDVFEFLSAGSYILWNDLSLYCVSPVSPFPMNPYIVYRGDVPMNSIVLITFHLLESTLPLLQVYSENQWIIHSTVKQERSCLIPGVSRVQPLRQIQLPFDTLSYSSRMVFPEYVPFLERDFRFLFKRNYEQELILVLNKAVLVDSIQSILDRNDSIVRLIYQNDIYDQSLVYYASQLGISVHSHGGSFPWVYRGVAHVLYHSIHVYLTCESVFPCDFRPFS